MYPDVGKSIKSVVSIVVKIGYAVSVIGAFLLLVLAMSEGEPEMFLLYAIVAAIVGALGCVGSWLGGLWLYAYGEITDRLISIDEKMKPAQPKKSALDNNSQGGCSCKSCGAQNNAGARYCSACGTAMTNMNVPKTGIGPWKCTCGFVNDSSTLTCHCGVNRLDI